MTNVEVVILSPSLMYFPVGFIITRCINRYLWARWFFLCTADSPSAAFRVSRGTNSRALPPRHLLPRVVAPAGAWSVPSV